MNSNRQSSCLFLAGSLIAIPLLILCGSCHYRDLPPGDPGLQRSRAVVTCIASDTPIPGGTFAAARPGDFRIENGMVYFVVGAIEHGTGYMKSGGNILDIGSDRYPQDIIDGLFTYHGDFPHQAIYRSLSVVADGRDGQPAVLEAQGDYSANPDIHITTRYILAPYVRYLVLETELENSGTETIDHFLLGDVANFGDARYFLTGAGYQLQAWCGEMLTALHDEISFALFPEQGGVCLEGEYADPVYDRIRMEPGTIVNYRRYLVVGEGDTSRLWLCRQQLLNEPYGRLQTDVIPAMGKAESGNWSAVVLRVEETGDVPVAVIRKREEVPVWHILPDGVYRIQAQMPGYREATSWAFQITAGEEFFQTVELAARGIRFIRAPYFSNLRPNGVTFHCLMDMSACGKLVLEGDQGVDRTVLLDSTAALQEIAIDNLEPGRYTCRTVVYDPLNIRPISSEPVQDLVIFDDRPKELRFSVYGDTRTHQDRHRRVAEALAARNPDFVVFTGDCVTNGRIRENWDEWFSAVSPLLSHTPVFPVLGNHEYNSPTYYQAFDTPKGGGDHGEQWYSADFGSLHLVVLDSDVRATGYEFSDLEAETSWLKADLAAHRDAAYTLVVFHHPLFVRSHTHTQETLSLVDQWYPVFIREGVDVVINGHVHAYARMMKEGILNLAIGAGGAPFTDKLCYRDVSSQNELLHTLLFVDFTLDDNGLRGDVVRVGARHQENDQWQWSWDEEPVIVDTFMVPRNSVQL